MFQDGSYDTLQANTARSNDLAQLLGEARPTCRTRDASRTYTKRRNSPANDDPREVHSAVPPPKGKWQRAFDRARTRAGKCRGVKGTSPAQIPHAARRVRARTRTATHRGAPNPTTERRFHTLAPQRFQARLTLFPKYFAPFPHGTCSLSGSKIY